MIAKIATFSLLDGHKSMVFIEVLTSILWICRFRIQSCAWHEYKMLTYHLSSSSLFSKKSFKRSIKYEITNMPKLLKGNGTST